MEECVYERRSHIVLKEESYSIVGAAVKLHATSGCGFLEAVYQEGMSIVL